MFIAYLPTSIHSVCTLLHDSCQVRYGVPLHTIPSDERPLDQWPRQTRDLQFVPSLDVIIPSCSRIL